MKAKFNKTEAAAHLGRELLKIMSRRTPDADQALALIAKGASLTEKDEVFRTALHHAALTNTDAALVQALIDKGANPYVRDAFAQTALDYAVKYEKEEGAAIMRTSTLNVTMGQQLLKVMGMRTPDQQAAIALIMQGASLQERDNMGRSLLHYAALAGGDGMTFVVDTAINKGANPHLKDAFGETGISYADKRGHEKMAASMRKTAHAAPDPAAGQLRRPPSKTP